MSQPAAPQPATPRTGLSTQAKARLAIVFTMVAWGTLAPFVRNIDLPSSELALYRAILAILLIGAYLLVTKQRIPLRAIKKELPLLVLSGVAMGFNWILLFEAYRYTTVATATLCYYLAPVFISLAAPFVLKERLTAKKLVCVIIAVFGMVPVSGILTAGFELSELRGVALGTGAALLYASVILLNKKLAGISAMDRTMVQLGAAGGVLIPYVLLTADLSSLSCPASGLWLLAVVAVVHTGVAYVLYFGAIPRLPAQTSAMLSYLDPVIAVLLSAVVLREELTILTALGAVMILGAAFLGEVELKKKQPVS